MIATLTIDDKPVPVLGAIFPQQEEQRVLINVHLG